MRFDETFVVDAIQVYRAVSAAGTERLFELPLGGTEVLT
jgi:hypothetical protein